MINIIPYIHDYLRGKTHFKSVFIKPGIAPDCFIITIVTAKDKKITSPEIGITDKGDDLNDWLDNNVIKIK